ncbi:TetR family transcriptional regulator [Streptosporangiaceae bacterium NEAU-GS5]|nr:TetR family transcriptional regulator [Streptosporangiaceae bacterium NEAU-GS5]
MQAEPGLRERKKRQTRQAIEAAAFTLFADRGFDAVTVAEVARGADVSEATVFNYFPTKEDLVYGRLEELEAALIQAIRDRGPGQSITAAFGRFLLGRQGALGDDDPRSRDRLTAISRIIAGSASLQARERHVYDRYTRGLAALIAEERSADPGDVEPWVVANAVIGVHRGLVEYVRGRVLAGESGPALAQAVRAQAGRALAVLDHGLARYPAAARPPTA